MHSLLTVLVWLTVCLPPLLYIKIQVYFSLPLISRGSFLYASTVLCDCDFSGFGGVLHIPCSPLSVEFYRTLYG